jgi:hypothetical protein
MPVATIPQHYRAICYGEGMSVLYAVIDGKEQIIRSDLTISWYRDYARGGGYILEQVNHEGRMAIFDWYKPGEHPNENVSAVP